MDAYCIIMSTEISVHGHYILTALNNLNISNYRKNYIYDATLQLPQFSELEDRITSSVFHCKLS